MNRNIIKKDIIQAINEQLATNINSENVEIMSLDELGLDSLDRLRIIMTLEEVFNIQIKDQEAGKWVTVKDIIDYIEYTVK